MLIITNTLKWQFFDHILTQEWIGVQPSVITVKGENIALTLCPLKKIWINNFVPIRTATFTFNKYMLIVKTKDKDLPDYATPG